MVCVWTYGDVNFNLISASLYFNANCNLQKKCRDRNACMYHPLLMLHKVLRKLYQC